MELTINNNVYQFSFNIGFLRNINKTITVDVDGMDGVKRNVGLRYSVGLLLDGDLETLVDVLELANKGQSTRLTKKAIEEFIDNTDTDVDEVFDGVIEGLKQANATKKATLATIEAIEKAQAEQETK
ncbi:tail assembly chaperone [Lactococcus piscium]|uniref:Phage protein n=1 Tax=Pseudolactococcus piscium MKFS47 TaxID=297352 RepID=A0A0D6DYW9_9LACT|nr:tail assembly chaperone [Lactococcus piscium]CEN29137.1 Phage protein [Lactococcus piscium MKFS47]